LQLTTFRDPRTRLLLERTGVGPGWRCLEVGAGTGTIAAWLGERVAASGRVISESVPTPVRRAVSKETAQIVSRWLEGVVTDPEGTGKRARLQGWRVAGKTGTAQKADAVSGGYSADKHFSSFVGFAPAQAPRVVIGVFVDEPKGEIYGGEVAAPVFREIAEHAMKAMAVPPSEPVAAAPPAPREEPVTPRYEPAPPPLEVAPRRLARATSGVAVPALEGLPARAALRALESVDLVGDVAGSGRVTAQSPRPGEVVERGARVRLVLAPPG